jgi:hypothetical protein
MLASLHKLALIVAVVLFVLAALEATGALPSGNPLALDSFGLASFCLAFLLP